MHITTGSTSVRAKPTDDQLDIYALTHQGMVRTENQDHFLVCQLKKQMEVLHTSLPNVSVIPADQERLAMLMMVADGVGGHFGGEEASRVAVKAVARRWARRDCVDAAVDARTLCTVFEAVADQMFGGVS